MTSKVCTSCNELKPRSEFYKDRSKKHGLQARCKECKNKATNEYRKRTGYDAKRYQRTRESEQERHLLSKYGITIQEYEKMFADQHGCCGICTKPHTGTRRFDVDHDHETGQVRGLLCTSCNRMLGHAGDSIKTLLSAAEYLKNVPQVAARFIAASTA